LTEPAPDVPRLYLVTDRHATGGRPLAAVVRRALLGLAGTGVPPRAVAVQLREKDLSGRALCELAHALRIETAAAGAQFYVNDRIDVALAVGADGVHLGGEALSAADARAIGPALAVGVSAHGLDDVRAAAGRADFAFLGPIYDTPSKRRYGSPLGAAALIAAAGLGLPLVAIGGIEPAAVGGAVTAGARGVACIRAVMSAADPAAAVRAFCEALAAIDRP
jgi:thiamine-phosphate pyrophosphorylase